MNKPKAAPARFPYDHANLKTVWRREALDKFNRLPVECRKGRTLEQFMESADD